MAALLNDDELELLECGAEGVNETLSLEARALYATVLRPAMDYGTGLVGRPAKISLSGLRKRLTVRRPPTSPLGDFVPSVQQVRRYLGELESVGLIQRVAPCGRHDPLVFCCVLATLGSFRSSKVQQGFNKGSSTSGLTTETPCGAVGVGDSGGVVGHGLNGEAQHISEISGLSTTTNIKNNINAGARAMTPFWEPSGWLVDQLKDDKPGFTAEVYRECLLTFRLYWIERGAVRAMWDSEFVAHCGRRLRWRNAEVMREAEREFSALGDNVVGFNRNGEGLGNVETA